MANELTALTGSRMILDLVATTRWTGMAQGKAAARSRTLRQSREYAPRRSQFLDECGQIPRAPRGSYVHPSSTPTAISYRRESGQAELTPAELVWIQRLPLDPKDVTHEDAARLAGMFGSIDRMKSPSSHQLVASVYQPVKELHDLRVAKQELELLRNGLPEIPQSARDALREALAEEHPDWPESAWVGEAGELLGAELKTRQARHEADVRKAEETVERLSTEAADRVVLTRESA